MVWTFVFVLLLAQSSGSSTADTVATQFIFSLPANAFSNTDLYVSVESRFVPSTICIETPHYVNLYNGSISKGVTKIHLNPKLAQNNIGITNNSILLTASTPVSVHVINYASNSVDGALILPVYNGLSEYFTASYTTTPGVGGIGSKSEIAIATLYDGTTINIELKTHSGTVDFNNQVYSNGDTIHVTLNSYGSLQLQHTTDLTGTHVTSNNPISVLCGVSCVNINHGYCDHIVDQIPPVSSWGSTYILTQLQTMPSVTFRIVAALDDTQVTIGSSETHTLGRGEFLDKRLTQTNAVAIQSTKPLLLVQFSEGMSDGHGDPFMIVVPSVDNFYNGYVFSTPGNFDSYHLTVTIETTFAPGLLINGRYVSRNDEKRTVVNLKGQSKSFSVIRLSLGSGDYNLTHDAGTKFGALQYGFGNYVSYGYSLGYKYTYLVGSRLVSGNGTKSGFLELRVGDTWVRACAGNIGLNEAKVICRAQGYYKYPLRHDGIRYIKSTHATASHQPSVQCLGSESDITQCRVLGSNHTCTLGEVFIDCAPPLEDIIHLQCTTSSWLVTVDIAKMLFRFPDFLTSDLYLGDNSCTGIPHGNNLLIVEDFTSCLSVQKSLQDGVGHYNQLVYAPTDPAHPSKVKTIKWRMELECNNLNYSGILIPLNHSVTFNNSISSSKYKFQLEYYQDSNYMQPLPGYSLTRPDGTAVYVKAYVTDADWSIKMSLNTCFTSALHGGEIQDYFLIKDSCEADTNTHVISETMHETRFSFQMFERTTGHDEVFVHCHPVYCDTSRYHSLQQCNNLCGPVNI